MRLWRFFIITHSLVVMSLYLWVMSSTEILKPRLVHSTRSMFVDPSKPLFARTVSLVCLTKLSPVFGETEKTGGWDACTSLRQFQFIPRAVLCLYIRWCKFDWFSAENMQEYPQSVCILMFPIFKYKNNVNWMCCIYFSPKVTVTFFMYTWFKLVDMVMTCGSSRPLFWTISKNCISCISK